MKRIVVKLGSSVLTKGTTRLNRQRMLELVQQIAALQESGFEMIVVSSGAQSRAANSLDSLISASRFRQSRCSARLGKAI